ncbi:MAG TPA: glucosyl-3-phosphoglycerate synthase [Solirubrobacteraceae bacterium]|nr:glucosyl-3-phosphoglycerate synthase [Solirubrobacteraceae bacterium]
MSVVVIPARDEQGAIATCLEALARQTVGTGAFEVIVVADACRDDTEAAARRAATRLGLSVTIIPGPGAGSGAARRVGMDAAAARLESLGQPHGLIASTDADSTPAEDWLERQLGHVARGAEVVAGLIELDPADAARLPDPVVRRRERDARRRLTDVTAREPAAQHHHFAGASLGVTAQTYRSVGGLEGRVALEDEAFAAKLANRGVAVLRPSDVRVRTSARIDGRARRGLSVDLAVSMWREQRRYRACDFEPEAVRAAKAATTVSVVLPAKDCARTIAGVLETTVAPATGAGLVDEVIVVDAASRDGTAACAAEAGAVVVQQDELLPEYGPALGKGDAMWRALHRSRGDVVCFLDADTEDPHPDHLLGLLGPLLEHPDIALVKGAFERPFRAGERTLPHEGGRVTEVMARPLLNLHFPLLAGFDQPLAGEFGARRDLLTRMSFPVGYGVEIAVLIDALSLCGLQVLAECHVGTRQNRHQPLRALGEMAFAVLAATERRIEGSPRSVTGGQYLRPWEEDPMVRVPIDERPPLTRRDADQRSGERSRDCVSSATD